MNQQPTLKKDLNLLAATALVVGMVIGSGIFMKPGKVIAAAGDSSMALVAWGLGGIITIAAGLTVAELGAQIPKTGGLYAYLDEVYGKMWGYLFGWVQTLIYGPATTGALGLYFASLLLPFFSLPEAWKLPVAIATVAFLGGVNALGTKYGGFIQSVSTAAKLVPIVIIAVFGLLKGNGQILSMPSGVAETAGMGAAILATLWAYDGWINVSFVAGEMKNPAKELPRSIIVGLGIVIVAYLSVNMALLHLLPASEIALLGNRAAGTAAGLLFGEMGGRLINIGILISIFGALNGYILTGARVPYAMAQNGLLPGSKVLGRVHSKSGAPANALILGVILAAALMTLGDPDRLTDMAMFIIWVFYILAFMAVFILRKRYPNAERPYSVPGYPVVPAIAILGSVYIAFSMLTNNPGDALYALCITLAGVPVYMILKRNK
ncbi:APC family permease [Sporomusa malonica]|uniref:Serine/threonine exchange transporter, LAT family n=1 Tax=Sporomusa malonica TaxID=112901 RepID=A0A1W2BVK5_9FIRM|nr:amino acid permease [Sporomusa malonica]SMC76774.1 serine/threonine exchange transporter, LAT family [Sporomusa malonica]